MLGAAMRCLRLTSCLLAAACALLLAACGPSAEEQMFEQLLATDYGGIRLGAGPADITQVHGAAAATATRQGGALHEHTYLPDRETEASADRPQLQLTYLDGQLVRIYNFERPFETDPVQPPAPIRVSIMPGVTLGARKSEFTSKLGSPNAGAMQDQWRFTGKDGRSIAIQAFFIENPETKDPVCNKLSITLAPKIVEPRGEQYDGK